MGKKKCFIGRSIIHPGWFRVWNKEPKWGGHSYISTPYVLIAKAISPQLKSMWKLALKNKRGKAAIAEVCPITWIPYIYNEECNRCSGNSIPAMGPRGRCELCDDTGRIVELMTAKDLK